MKFKIFTPFAILCACAITLHAQNNRAPLRANPYSALPLGAIRAEGWLKEMLIRQRDGATGSLDELYPSVIGQRNGWLGGDGDQWERGPYWVDGLLPLAYQLNDEKLIAKTKRWVEWTLASQQPDGYFGPAKDYSPEPGLQRNNSRDWWPKMVMLKVLMQYYSATQDKRVPVLMTKYFQYQLKELPKTPLDHWTFWARYRGADNLMAVYWLYNITGDKFLLDLAEIIHKQTFDYTNSFLDGKMLTEMGSIHCVNLAQGIKAPLIYYQQHPEEKYVQSVVKAFQDIRKYNGMVHGLYGGDEMLHGNNPTQGSELCSAVEMMYSLESMLGITGDVGFADHLERIAFNALPTQVTDDFMARQYFQQANQVMITRGVRNFIEDGHHDGTDLCFGFLTGYPCCTSNMHQGWPKFVQNLWYASDDGGLAALVYGPNVVSTVVNGTSVTIEDQTSYPFEESVTFKLKMTKPATFPFHLRIPAWCTKTNVLVNGDVVEQAEGDRIVKLKRDWKSGDVVELQLPMHISKSTWYQNSMSVERGPLVFALKIGEEWKKKQNEKDPEIFGATYFEVLPKDPWNYGIVGANTLEKDATVEAAKTIATYPWNLDNAPVKIKIKAKRIPSWKLYNDMTGPIPYSIVGHMQTDDKEEEITLIPYGCSTLRISQFPVISK